MNCMYLLQVQRLNNKWLSSFPSALQSNKFFCALHYSSQPSKTNTTTSFRGQRFLDFISAKPNPNVSNDRQKHLRLIQDFLQTNSIPFLEPQIDSYASPPNPGESSIAMLFQLHNAGSSFEPSLVSNTLSLCGSERALMIGVQVHCLALVNGFLSNIHVGSSLISFYGKCGFLDSACKAFGEMPEKNIVSWTAMINGFAQECQVDMCFKLYTEMRNSTMRPNDFTFTSFLSACTVSGCIGQGRSVHCQVIRMGFGSYVHIANALISMYSKCGNVEDALYVFRKIRRKDLVSWNSMIAGYAQHGHAKWAIKLFEKMREKKREKPDAITFLAILSSCRHAGFVKQGKSYFASMAKYAVKPGLDHYSCIVDLLGRAGLVEEAWGFIKKMPVSPNAIIWGSLLSSCRLHGNVWIGIEAAEKRLVLEPSCPATHLQLAHMYASVGHWEQAARVRKLMKDKELKTDPGCSWIEIKNGVFEFRAEDRSNSNLIEILAMVDGLVGHMRGLSYLPKIFEEMDYHL